MQKVDLLLELATKWSHENGWSEPLYLESGELAAFPPNGVMPIALPEGVRDNLLEKMRQADPGLQSYYFIKNFTLNKIDLFTYLLLSLAATYGVLQARQWYFGDSVLALALVMVWSDFINRAVTLAIARVRYRRLHRELQKLGYL